MQKKPWQYVSQGSQEWHDYHKNLSINASAAGVALGWRGKKELHKYWHNKKGISMENTTVNDSMRWGNLCEKSALLTYKEYFKSVEVKTSGLAINEATPWLGASTDGLAGVDTLIEIKCPYKNGASHPYRSIPVSHFLQCQLQMHCNNKSTCHYVVYTPKSCTVHEIKFDRKFVDQVIHELSYFHDSLKGSDPPGICANLNNLEQMAKDLAKNAKFIKKCN